MSGEEPAFPTPAGHAFVDGRTVQLCTVGLTKRELFAAMAMEGLLTNLLSLRSDGWNDYDIDTFAVMRADALINKLSPTQTETKP